jgi:hypothetical protein
MKVALVHDFLNQYGGAEKVTPTYHRGGDTIRRGYNYGF